jgi:pimeloyl-ACP methyl ester carboxylesterase
MTLFLKLPNRKLAYQQWGDGANEKVLVCVHGLSRNSHDFDYIAKELAMYYRVICIDIAGRGQSDWLEDKSGYTYPNYISDILMLLGTLNIKKVDWLGTSMGGIIGILMASMQPGLINKIVLNDIGFLVSGAALDRIFEYVAAAPLFDTREQAEAAIRSRMTTFGIESEEHWRHITKYSVEAAGDKFRFAYDPQIIKKPSAFSRIIANLKAFVKLAIARMKQEIDTLEFHPSQWLKMADIDLSPYWDKVTCPVLLLRGELSDILSRDTANKMQTSHRNVELVEFKNVGHAPMLMDAAQIAVVKKWLLESGS